MHRVKVAVVGAGVVGLSTAVVIAEALPHCSVTVLADRFTPNTTSDGAAGILFASQFPDVPVEQQRRWFKRTFDHLLLIASSPEAGVAGVFLSSGWQIFREVPPEKKPYWSDCVLSFGTMTDAELKRFPQYKFGQAFTTIKCECPSYLPWLQKRLEKAGGIMIHEKVTDLAELGLRYDVIVNCSGLGSRELLGDEDAADSQAIFERCRRLEPSLGSARPLGEWVGLRPGRRNPRVERGHVRVHGRRVPVVHNYGHGGWGITLSWGTALDALDLVRQCLNERPPEARL
uniref:D-aspartate oxidase n=1 Tax=Scleropages formosus TaxID=113540 RepID=A0A8C9RR86_SCLFO